MISVLISVGCGLAVGAAVTVSIVSTRGFERVVPHRPSGWDQPTREVQLPPLDEWRGGGGRG